MLKELNEIAPVIAECLRWVEDTDTAVHGRMEVVDLCSGYGYLGMFLSEMLPPSKVEMITLVDIMWPMHNQPDPPKEGQLDPTHLQLDGWPIRLGFSHQDLKKSGNRRRMGQRLFTSAEGPVIILAVHLCGTLSIHATELFNAYPQVPICLHIGTVCQACNTC